MENINWKKDFEERDILDDFDIFAERGKYKKHSSFSGIINEFIDYIYDDIRNAYPNKEIQKEIKKHIRGICFNNEQYLINSYNKKGSES